MCHMTEPHTLWNKVGAFVCMCIYWLVVDLCFAQVSSIWKFINTVNIDIFEKYQE